VLVQLRAQGRLNGHFLQQSAKVRQILLRLELPADLASQRRDVFRYLGFAHLPSPLSSRLLVYEQLHNLIYRLITKITMSAFSVIETLDVIEYVGARFVTRKVTRTIHSLAFH